MHARIRLVVLALLAMLGPSTLGAQQTNARAVAGAGPRIDAVVTGFRAPEQSPAVQLNLQRSNRNMGQPVALMVVGGAAIVIGAFIGGDVGTLFMIGGAVALLIGLYRYLQ